MTIRRTILRNAYASALRTLSAKAGMDSMQAHRLHRLLGRIRHRVEFAGIRNAQVAAGLFRAVASPTYTNARHAERCKAGRERTHAALADYLASKDAQDARAEHVLACCKASEVEHAESHHDEKTGTIVILGKLRGEWGSWLCEPQPIPGLYAGRYYGRDCTGSEAQDRFDDRIAGRD